MATWTTWHMAAAALLASGLAYTGASANSGVQQTCTDGNYVAGKGNIANLRVLSERLRCLRTKQDLTTTDLNVELNKLEATYLARSRRQSQWLGRLTYTSVAGAATAVNTPELGIVAALPILLDKIEDYDSTRTLYTVGSNSLGLLRSYYNELSLMRTTALAARASAVNISSEKLTTACNSVRIENSKADKASLVHLDTTALMASCTAIEAGLTDLGRYYSGLSNAATELDINRALLCDVARFDRILMQRDAQLQLGPGNALSATLSVVPTVLQGLVAPEELKLQSAGRIQTALVGLSLRIGSLDSLTPQPNAAALPVNIGQLNGATLSAEGGPELSKRRREIGDVLGEAKAEMELASRIGKKIEPILIEFNFEPASSSVRLTKIATTAEPNLGLLGC